MPGPTRSAFHYDHRVCSLASGDQPYLGSVGERPEFTLMRTDVRVTAAIILKTRVLGPRPMPLQIKNLDATQPFPAINLPHRPLWASSARFGFQKEQLT
jgi:hypothetical protein